jgi:hypothetical protein
MTEVLTNDDRRQMSSSELANWQEIALTWFNIQRNTRGHNVICRLDIVTRTLVP